MNIKELIEELEEIREKVGDDMPVRLSVCIEDPMGEADRSIEDDYVSISVLSDAVVLSDAWYGDDDEYRGVFANR